MNLTSTTFRIKQSILSALKLTFSYCLSAAALIIVGDILGRVTRRYFHLPDTTISMDFLHALFVEHYLPIYIFTISFTGYMAVTLLKSWADLGKENTSS
ncbi:hypothetical protein ACO0LB_18010 [Undibacterium sp. SXout7W]|uniref:hypothetical protein n=1 Tax=Undibacterium sp. SXout7W TaxID=3413049 RepID=UPI003BF16AA4